MSNKKPYERPCVEKISFCIEEGLMTSVDIGGDLTFSTGGGDIPWLQQDEGDFDHPYQLD